MSRAAIFDARISLGVLSAIDLSVVVVLPLVWFLFLSPCESSTEPALAEPADFGCSVAVERVWAALVTGIDGGDLTVLLTGIDGGDLTLLATGIARGVWAVLVTVIAGGDLTLHVTGMGDLCLCVFMTEACTS